MTNAVAGARFADVFRIRTFRVFYGAELQSIIGDQLARVALSVLVFERTDSAPLTTLVYALTFLPAIVGGVALAHVGDRWARPTVMIACDVLRAAAFAAMAIPRLPIVAVAALLVAAVFVAPTFSAASASLLAARLTEDQFRTASGVRMTTNQLAQVLGFAVAGLLVAAAGAREALLINAATYVVSAGVVLRWLRDVPGSATATPRAADDPRTTRVEGTWAVLAAVLRDPQARTMLLLSLLAGLFVVPESIAIPFATQISASTVQAGLLLATIPLGSAVGIVLLVRVVRTERRHGTALAMAVLTGAPLVLTAPLANLPAAEVCWLLSGVAAAYQVEVFVSLVRWVPDEGRARLVSVCGSLLLGSQGLGPLAFGAMATVSSPATAVSLAGGTGVVAAAVILAFGPRQVPGRHARAAVAGVLVPPPE